MPWPNAHFDMIICLTTIEHVADVGRSVAEIARVLVRDGIAVIEAPNYLWPSEPHLGIFVPPLAPKALMRVCARLQGRSDLAWYLDHLKQVHPRMMERLFRANGLRYLNLAAEKLERTAVGDAADVLAYKRIARALGGLRRMGLAKPLARAAGRLGLYPSLLYRLKKERA
jgi:SAM-dependent methyltransferase